MIDTRKTPNPGRIMHESHVVDSLQVVVHSDPVSSQAKFFLESPVADTFLGMIVATNALLVGIQVELGDEAPMSLMVLENIFVAIYSLECLAWISRLRLGYFKAVSRLLDFGIVCVSVVDAWVLSPLGSDSDVKFMKVLRLIRLVRVLRVIRLLRFFSELSAVVRAFTVSVDVIAWTFFLLFLTTYSYAMAFKAGMDFIMPADSPVYALYFGSIFGSAFTLFQLMTFSNAHENILRPLMRESPYPYVTYVVLQVFVVITRYGLLTTALGVFVHNVHENERVRAKARSDAAVTRTRKIVDAVIPLFPQMDGRIDLSCFLAGCSDPAVVLCLRELDLHWIEPVYFFKLLDSERKDYLTPNELADRLVEVKRGAPLLPLHTISEQIGTISHKIGLLEKRTKKMSLEEHRKILRDLEFACDNFLTNTTNPIVLKRVSGHITSTP